MPLICTICDSAFLPPRHWQDEWCPGCAGNFRASPDRRGPDEAEAQALPLTPRQIRTMLRLVSRQAREDLAAAEGEA